MTMLQHAKQFAHAIEITPDPEEDLLKLALAIPGKQRRWKSVGQYIHTQDDAKQQGPILNSKWHRFIIAANPHRIITEMREKQRLVEENGELRTEVELLKDRLREVSTRRVA